MARLDVATLMAGYEGIAADLARSFTIRFPTAASPLPRGEHNDDYGSRAQRKP
jgi:hypothetical protein